MVWRALRGGSLACALAAALALPAAASAPAPVPRGFVGVNVDGPIFPGTAPGVNLNAQLGAMVAAGVESIRVVFDWSYAQPYRSPSEVPAALQSQFVTVGGVPTRFSQIDEIVGLAARHGLTVLPTVMYAPSWDVTGNSSQSFGRPARTGPYAAFLTDLIDRYGPHGSFWHGYGTKLPIRRWQIWNEPDQVGFWPTQPFAKTYVALLRAAHAAVGAADPGAQVVLAGLPDFSWKLLASIYAIHGARSLFDVVGVHPYTGTPAGVITIIGKVRHVMDRFGDASKPIIADEWGWPSSVGQTPPVDSDITTTEKGQARNVAALMPLLAADRRQLGLAGFYFYTWAGAENRGASAFSFAGLLRYHAGKLTRKPAFAAFKRAALAMEGCRRRGALASECAVRTR